MASLGRPSRFDELPDEILLQILSYLDPHRITRLQLVSRKIQRICLDDGLWKRSCFDESPWYQALKNRRQLLGPPTELGDGDEDGALLLNPETTVKDSATGEEGGGDDDDDYDDYDNDAKPGKQQQRRWRHLQDMANWDPAFPGEQVSWYDEYIQRNGPASVNWLQTPHVRDRGYEAIIEARGVELYNPHGGNDGLGTMLAVSPLDDGSVCLWDVKGTRSTAGAVIARSRPAVLFVNGLGGQNARRSRRIDTGVTECVSVDNRRHRAYFAVQSHLFEVDLNRLEVVSRESFEWSITTLSPIHDDVPLTVGTSRGIHLHDFRAKARVAQDVVEYVDGSSWNGNDVLKSIFDPRPLPPYSSIAQSTPVSILHLPCPGSQNGVSHDIFVGGRFSSILHYDRRKFPGIVDSIYSGSTTVNSLAALPYPFSTVDNEIRRQGELTAEQVERVKASEDGRTLIAGGTYKSKGSLEIYGLGPATDAVGRKVLRHHSVMKNRQSAASSSILSVTNHGTKIVFSDGGGFLNWFERDGSTECRRLRIGHCEGEDAPSLFASMSAAGELARKVVSTQSQDVRDRPNNDNLLFWTGERLGLVSFTPKPVYHSKDFDDDGGGGEGAPETTAEEEERRRYKQRMHEALSRQADEVRFMARLGEHPRTA